LLWIVAFESSLWRAEHRERSGLGHALLAGHRLRPAKRERKSVSVPALVGLGWSRIGGSATMRILGIVTCPG